MRTYALAVALIALSIGPFGAAARADLMLQLPDGDPTFQLDGSLGYLSSTSGPNFAELPAVPYIHGLKISGSATYIKAISRPSLDPQLATLSLTTIGAASGSNYLPDFIYIDYDVNFVKSRAIPLHFLLSVTFHFADPFTGVPTLATNGLDLAISADTNFARGQLAVDVSETGSLLGTSYEITTAIVFDQRDLELGESIQFQIPSSSIDVGVRARSVVVPEPSSIVLSSIGVLILSAHVTLRRRSSDYRAAAGSRGAGRGGYIPERR